MIRHSNLGTELASPVSFLFHRVGCRRWWPWTGRQPRKVECPPISMPDPPSPHQVVPELIPGVWVTLD